MHFWPSCHWSRRLDRATTSVSATRGATRHFGYQDHRMSPLSVSRSLAPLGRVTGQEVAVPAADRELRPVVSLQDRSSADDALKGHLASGALLGSDVAVFPLPEELELPIPLRVEVLLAPLGVGENAVVERIRPAHIEVASLESAPGARVMLVRLAQPSRYGSEPPTSEEMGAAIASAADAADLRHVLAALDVRADLAPDGLTEHLAEVRALEQANVDRIVVFKLGRRPEDIANCVLSPRCKPSWPFFHERLESDW